MSEDQYISALMSRWPHEIGAEVTLDTIALADKAVLAFPTSPRLLVMRGNLITLGPEESPYCLDDALACYQGAIQIDPLFAEAWEEVGFHLHNVRNDELAAVPYFREAERLKRRFVP